MQLVRRAAGVKEKAIDDEDGGEDQRPKPTRAISRSLLFLDEPLFVASMGRASWETRERSPSVIGSSLLYHSTDDRTTKARRL